jgi:hypothetical protein
MCSAVVLSVVVLGALRMTNKPRFDDKKNAENKRKALEALELRGDRREAAAAAGIHLKTLKGMRSLRQTGTRRSSG